MSKDKKKTIELPDLAKQPKDSLISKVGSPTYIIKTRKKKQKRETVDDIRTQRDNLQAMYDAKVTEILTLNTTIKDKDRIASESDTQHKLTMSNLEITHKGQLDDLNNINKILLDSKFSTKDFIKALVILVVAMLLSFALAKIR